MARIRTIKPEFPQSEAIGKLSRDARLLFIQLWTICDDSGKARAASRMLASLLYPYDDDAPKLMPKWLKEIAHAGLIRLYTVDGSQYLDIPNWLKHQKIDRPSISRLPSFDEGSRVIAEDQRGSDADLGPRTVDLGKDLGPGADAPDAVREAFKNYNESAAKYGWVKAKTLDADRRKKIKARLDEHTPEGWDIMLGTAGRSTFLRTEFPLKLDWVLEPKNFRKVIEGNYDDKGGTAETKPANSPDDWAWKLKWHRESGIWNPSWGPQPGQPGCFVPRELLT